MHFESDHNIGSKLPLKQFHESLMIFSQYIPTLPLVKKFTIIHKFRIARLVSLGLLLPVMEVSLIGSVYIILNGQLPISLQTLFGQVFKGQLGNSGESAILILCVICVSGIFILGFLKRHLAIITAKTTYDIYQDEVNTTSKLYFNIPGWAHLKEQNDDILNIIFNISGITAQYYISLIKVVNTCIPITILIIAASLSSFYLTVIALFIGTLTIIINYWNFNNMQSIATEQQTIQKTVIHEIYQNILSFELIKFDQLQTPILKKIRKVIAQDWQWRVQRRTTIANTNVMSDLIGLIAILTLAGINTLIINAPVETFIVIILLLNRLRGYTSELQSSILELKGSLPSVMKSLETHNRLNNYSNQSKTHLNEFTHIKFNNVNFNYGNKHVLKNINLNIAPGKWVLLSGQSGEGKSTLLKLMTGYYQPNSGTIILNDNQESIQELDFNSIQQEMFYSNNDLYLPDTSLKEAIDRNNTMSDEEITQIIHKSCLAELLTERESLNIQIGENASNLSEGQRQRLILSRLFLKTPRIVILDEATSNLDQQTELNIFENIQKHLGDHSVVIMAAHKTPADLTFHKTLNLHKGELKQNTLIK